MESTGGSAVATRMRGGDNMDFEKGSRYLITVNYLGYPGEPFEATYAGMSEQMGVEYHGFVADTFWLGVPDDRVGIDFKIELI